MARVLRAAVLAVLITGTAVCAQGEDITSAEQLDFANGLFQRGMYGMAVDEYKKYIQLFPKSDVLEEAYFGIAESEFFDKKYEDAVESFKLYVKTFPKGKGVPISVLRVGQALFILGKIDESIEAFGLVDRNTLEDKFKEMLYYYYGRGYKAKGDMKTAEIYFNDVLKIKEDTDYKAYSLMELGDIYALAKNKEKAVKYYSDAIQAAGTPDIKSSAMYKKASEEFTLEDYNAAAKGFNDIIAAYPNQPIAKQALLNMCLSLLNDEQYEQVISLFEKNRSLAEQKKEFFELFYALACANQALSRAKEALLVLDNTLSIPDLNKDDKYRALLKKSEILINAKDTAKAMEVIAEIKTFADKMDAALFMEAEVNYSAGEYPKAVLLYEQVIKDFPKSTYAMEAVYGTAFTYKMLNDDKNAGGYFLKYFKEGKSEHKREEALYNAILLELKSGSIDAAITYSIKFLDEFKAGNVREKVLFRLGIIYSNRRDFVNAIKTFTNFVAEYPDSSKKEEAYFQLALNEQLAGRFKEAVGNYSVLLDSKDKQMAYVAKKNTALSYLDLGENKKASDLFFDIIIKYSSNDLKLDIYFWTAKQCLDARKYGKVILVMQRMIKKKDSRFRYKEISYFRGEAYRGLKNYARAIKNYELAIAGKNKVGIEGPALVGKGLSYLGLKELDKAKAEFEAALTESPDDNTLAMRARFELANVEVARKDLDKAAKLFMLIAVLYNDDEYCPRALYSAGDIFEKNNRISEARNAYKEIVEKYPKSRSALQAAAKLEKMDE